MGDAVMVNALTAECSECESPLLVFDAFCSNCGKETFSVEWPKENAATFFFSADGEAPSSVTLLSLGNHRDAPGNAILRFESEAVHPEAARPHLSFAWEVDVPPGAAGVETAFSVEPGTAILFPGGKAQLVATGRPELSTFLPCVIVYEIRVGDGASSHRFKVKFQRVPSLELSGDFTLVSAGNATRPVSLSLTGDAVVVRSIRVIPDCSAWLSLSALPDFGEGETLDEIQPIRFVLDFALDKLPASGTGAYTGGVLVGIKGQDADLLASFELVYCDVGRFSCRSSHVLSSEKNLAHFISVLGCDNHYDKLEIAITHSGAGSPVVLFPEIQWSDDDNPFVPNVNAIRLSDMTVDGSDVRIGTDGFHAVLTGSQVLRLTISPDRRIHEKMDKLTHPLRLKGKLVFPCLTEENGKLFYPAISIPVQWDILPMEYEDTLPLAIDFGTSATTVAHYEGTTLTHPNLNEYDSLAKDGVVIRTAAQVVDKTEGRLSLIIGADAMEEHGNATCITELKRFMGTDAVLDPVITQRGEILREVPVNDVIREMLRAFIRRTHSRRAESRRRTPGDFRVDRFERLAVTVPCCLDITQEEGYLELLADLGYPRESIDILDEATAAALGAITGRDFLENHIRPRCNPATSFRMLVCDIGGGTTDVSLMRVDAKIDPFGVWDLAFHQENFGGNEYFGGTNITLAVARIALAKGSLVVFGDDDSDFAQQLREAVREFGLPNGRLPLQKLLQDRHWRMFLDFCETRKIMLSNGEESCDLPPTIPDSWFTDILGLTMTSELWSRLQRIGEERITIGEMNSEVRDELEKTIGCIIGLFRRHGRKEAFEPPDYVLLAGRSSNVPVVREMLLERLSSLRENIKIGPENLYPPIGENEANETRKKYVSLGALKFAESRIGIGSDIRVRFVDQNGESSADRMRAYAGIGGRGGNFLPIIDKLSSLPAVGSIRIPRPASGRSQPFTPVLSFNEPGQSGGLISILSPNLSLYVPAGSKEPLTAVMARGVNRRNLLYFAVKDGETWLNDALYDLRIRHGNKAEVTRTYGIRVRNGDEETFIPLLLHVHDGLTLPDENKFGATAQEILAASRLSAAGYSGPANREKLRSGTLPPGHPDRLEVVLHLNGSGFSRPHYVVLGEYDCAADVALSGLFSRNQSCAAEMRREINGELTLTILGGDEVWLAPDSFPSFPIEGETAQGGMYG